MRHPHFMLAALVALTAACGETPAGPTEEAPEALEDNGPATIPTTGKTDAIAAQMPAYGPLPTYATLEHDFEALFAPDDPVNTIEVALIDEVVAARAEDATPFYEEGANPFRIQYAVYNLRNPEIVNHLIAAEEANVDVQVLIEADQLDPARDWNTSDEDMAAAGLEVIGSHRDLTEATRASADLVGITGYGLMHLKARVFTTPDETVVYSGSLNPGDNAMMNEEAVHLIRDPALTARYVDAFERIRDDEDLINTWDNEAAVNVLFSPADGERASTRLFEWLEAEDEQILMMVYSLRDITAPGYSESLVDLLARKAAEGVDVYLITDRKQSDGVDADGNPQYYNDGTEDRLRRAGVHVYEATNRRSPYTAMHHKTVVLGRTHARVITDTANWSYAALGSSTRSARNTESMLFIDSDALDGGHTHRRYLGQWLRVLERYAEQSAGDGEPDYATVRDTLLSREGWPTALIDTNVRVHTQWGDSVYLVGNQDALGQWGQLHNGVALTTDGDRYPYWYAADAAALPIGQPISFKLTLITSSGGRIWEAGSDREATITPSPLVDPTRHVAGSCVLQGGWR